MCLGIYNFCFPTVISQIRTPIRTNPPKQPKISQIDLSIPRLIAREFHVTQPGQVAAECGELL